MDRRTRHRITVYSSNQKGELVEFRVRQAPTADEAVRLAVAAAHRPPLAAIAYTVEIDADGWECAEPVVLGRFGAFQGADAFPSS